MMQFQDLEVLKDIPGYRPILKAVLKSQIQILVEQLSAHTEEESVLLTASVTDGSLSHMGSDTGKSFLDGHEEIKSQFLGHCLKKHQKRKADELEAEEAAKRRQSLPVPFHPQHTNRPRPFNYQKRARSMGGPNTPRFGSPRLPHPVMLSKAGTKRARTVQHGFPSSTPSQDIVTSAEISIPSNTAETFTSADSPGYPQPRSEALVVKMEDQSGTNDNNHKTLDHDTSQTSEMKGSETTQTIDDQPKTEPSAQPGTDTGDSDNDPTGSSVKLEPVDADDIDDLQITGVELANMAEGGQMSSDWSQNVMDFGASTSAAGGEYSEAAQSMDSLQDLSSSGPYSTIHLQHFIRPNPTDAHDASMTSTQSSETRLCGTYVSKWSRATDVSIPRCERSYGNFECEVCGRAFNRKDSLKRHYMLHTNEKPIECTICHQKFRQKYNYNSHMALKHSSMNGC